MPRLDALALTLLLLLRIDLLECEHSDTHEAERHADNTQHDAVSEEVLGLILRAVDERRADPTEVAQPDHQRDSNTLLRVSTGVVRGPRKQNRNSRVRSRSSEERAQILILGLLRVRLRQQDRKADDSERLRDEDEGATETVAIGEVREEERDAHGDEVRWGGEELGVGCFVAQVGYDGGEEEGEAVDDDGVTRNMGKTKENNRISKSWRIRDDPTQWKQRQ